MEFFGRLHPLLLHLPIGFLLLAFLMELKNRWSKNQDLRSAISFALSLGTLSAVVAAASGYLLSREGGYDKELLSWHQWLGIGTAVLAIVVKVLHSMPAAAKFYFPSFGLMVLVLSGAGHYGGSLTHGSDFLTAPFEEEEVEKVIASVDEALVFEDIIQPIFKKKCVACHKPSKSKGGLLLTSMEEIEEGGDSGAFLVKSNAANSLFLQRAHLPLEDKKHMPPKGKLQLTEEEIQLLEWWVEEGAVTQQAVAQSEVSEEIEIILTQYIQPASRGVLDLKVDFASERHLNALKNAGFDIEFVEAKKPFVSAIWKRKNSPTNADLKLLKKIDEQLINLDLNGVELSGSGMRIIGNLPHLQKLFLQKTTITSDQLQALQNTEYLSYLNVYETAIDDKALVHLEQFKQLKKLFLWQTKTTTEGVADLQQALPNLYINTGVAASIFGDVAIEMPRIVTDKEMFTDSLLVELKHGLPDTRIYYTIDGSQPDSTSSRYEKPFFIHTSTEISVFGQKEGWQDSEVLTQFFPKVGYEIVAADLSAPPATAYGGDGSQSLIDLKKGTTDFRDGRWLGYERQHVEVQLDLGKATDISRVTISALEDTGSYIFFPRGFDVLVSQDGQKFQKIATESYPTANEPSPSTLDHFTTDFPTTVARFIKVNIKSQLKNPQWHAAPGAPSWVFVDEILVE
ncbi:MAG: chitobiase/beta-hexosaminidase C-terminal domain-containing protein [Bacteroidota bacterium]